MCVVCGVWCVGVWVCVCVVCVCVRARRARARAFGREFGLLRTSLMPAQENPKRCKSHNAMHVLNSLKSQNGLLGGLLQLIYPASIRNDGRRLHNTSNNFRLHSYNIPSLAAG